MKAGKAARKATLRKAFQEMLDTLAISDHAPIPDFAGMPLSSVKLVLELMAQDAGVTLFFHGTTVTV